MVVATKTDLLKAINEFYVTGKDAAEREGGTLLDQALQKSYVEGNLGPKVEDKGVTADSELSVDRLIAKAGEAPVVKLVEQYGYCSGKP